MLIISCLYLFYSSHTTFFVPLLSFIYSTVLCFYTELAFCMKCAIYKYTSPALPFFPDGLDSFTLCGQGRVSGHGAFPGGEWSMFQSRVSPGSHASAVRSRREPPGHRQLPAAQRQQHSSPTGGQEGKIWTWLCLSSFLIPYMKMCFILFRIIFQNI